MGIGGGSKGGGSVGKGGAGEGLSGGGEGLGPDGIGGGSEGCGGGDDGGGRVGEGDDGGGEDGGSHGSALHMTNSGPLKLHPVEQAPNALPTLDSSSTVQSRYLSAEHAWAACSNVESPAPVIAHAPGMGRPEGALHTEMPGWPSLQQRMLPSVSDAFLHTVAVEPAHPETTRTAGSRGERGGGEEGGGGG